MASVQIYNEWLDFSATQAVLFLRMRQVLWTELYFEI